MPAAAAAKSLQSCLTLCDPMMAAHQAPPSLGFSRQEYRSGLPFPSPMHESESEVAQSCPTLYLIPKNRSYIKTTIFMLGIWYLVFIGS